MNKLRSRRTVILERTDENFLCNGKCRCKAQEGFSIPQTTLLICDLFIGIFVQIVQEILV